MYDLLGGAVPSPIIELNRAVAVAMRDGPQTGVELVDTILARGDLENHGPAHTARAELCRQLERRDEAVSAYGRPLTLVRQGPERRYLERRLRGMS